MLEVKADLWTVPCEARVITTNGSVTKAGRAVLGRGCALEAARRWPQLPEQLGGLLRFRGRHVYVFQGLDVVPLVSFPVKYRWQDPANLDLIQESAEQLVEQTARYGWTRVALPRPGCGNGHRTWAEVKPRLEPWLDDRFLVVSFVHEG